MTITFQTDNDLIVYALEKILSYAREYQYIFLAENVWWISSIIGLQERLVIHIDTLKASEVQNREQSNIDCTNHFIHSDRVVNIQDSNSSYIDSESESVRTTKSEIHNEVIENCEAFLEQCQ
jgi:hypothetical protein